MEAMLASLSEAPITGQGLVYEPKYDGIRAIVTVTPGKARGPATVSIVSRNGNDKTKQFPELVRTLELIGARLERELILDGEIVAVDPSGRPLGFQYVQGRIHLSAAPDIARAERVQPTALILFDLLKDGSEDLRPQPLVARRLRLQERIRPRAKEPRFVRLSEITLDDGRALLQRARAEGWEGLIVKDAQSRYFSGKRTPAWRKMKLLKQQEFVVGGWTEPRQSRPHFGSLLVGYYDNAGRLRFAGLVGTGFDQKELARVAKLLAARETSTSPFHDVVKTPETAHWVKPAIVAEVRFTEWTTDGLLRQPVYVGTRDDKKPRDVIREEEKKVRSQKSEVRSTAEPHAEQLTKPVGRQTKRAGGGGTSAQVASVEGLVERLRDMEAARKDGEIRLPNGDALNVTNLGKMFWSDLKITKGDLLRFYAEVSPLLLPVLEDRPLVMRRFPNGVGKPAFYQQRHPEAPPPGVRRMRLPADVDPPDEEGPRDRLIGGSLTTLLYMTQLASISQDPWFSKVGDPWHCDQVAIDLDPGDEAGFDKVLDVARWVKDELDTLGVPSLPKTSGSSGLHIFIPLPAQTTYESGQLLCNVVATLVSQKHPRVATIERMVRRRPRGTVYVDYLQNILGKTLASAYSVRASDYAGVSTPLTWKEVARGVDPREFTIRTALARFRKVGDLWAELRTMRPVDLNAVLARGAGEAPKHWRRRK
jgi:bifunctional non-homologous end joining protein LigD